MAPKHTALRIVVVGWPSLYLVVVVITALAQRCQVRVTGRLAAWVMNDLRVKVFTHLQRLSLDFFTEEKAGRDHDPDDERHREPPAAAAGRPRAVRHPGADHGRHHRRFCSPSTCELALITMLLIVPALTVVSLWFRAASERGYDRVRDGIAGVLADLSESLHGVRIVTAHNRQRHNIVHHRNVVGRLPGRQQLHGPDQRHLRPGHPAARRTSARRRLLAIGGDMVLHHSLSASAP